MKSMSFIAQQVLLFSFLLFGSDAGNSQQLDLDWYSIGDSVMLRSEGGPWDLNASVGQAVASAPDIHSGGQWQITSGFLSIQSNGTDFIFSSDFERISVRNSQTLRNRSKQYTNMGIHSAEK